MAGEETFTGSQRDVPVDTGTLKKSGNLVKLPNGFRIVYRTSYAATQEFGKPAGTREVVKRHRVKGHNRTRTKPKRKTVTIPPHYRGPFNRVYKQGIKGRHYVGDNWNKVRPRLLEFIKQAARRN